MVKKHTKPGLRRKADKLLDLTKDRQNERQRDLFKEQQRIHDELAKKIPSLKGNRYVYSIAKAWTTPHFNAGEQIQSAIKFGNLMLADVNSKEKHLLEEHIKKWKKDLQEWEKIKSNKLMRREITQ